MKLQRIPTGSLGHDFLRQKAILETKQSLYEMCQEKANEYLMKTDEDVGQVYLELYHQVKQLLSRSFQLSEQVNANSQQNVS